MSSALNEVLSAVDAGHADARAELEALSRIPSIAFEGYDPAPVQECAEATAGLLDRSGLDGVRLLDGPEGCPPAVFGEVRAAPADAPTVLLYAHHDVQPTGDVDLWTSPPFEPTERDGRLYGRGCADDKAGVVAHAAALDAWTKVDGGPPVNVKVIIEGEEEIGSPHLDGFLAQHGELLRADAVVVADLVNWKVGTPSLTYVLRGMVDVEVEVRVMTHSVHSGMYGGPVPDPVTALLKLIAGLTDETGAIAVPALREGLRTPTADERRTLAELDFDEAAFRADAGLLPGVPFGGDPDAHPLQKVWMEPNLTVLGIDVPSAAGASNTIQPSARAKLGLRVGPGQDATGLMHELVAHLSAQAPMGIEVHARPGAAGQPFETRLDSPAAGAMLQALQDGYGAQPVAMGCGGSIPLLDPLQDAFPDATMLMVGVEDPGSRAHGIDESLHLGDWRSACRSVAAFFAHMSSSGAAAGA